MLIVLTTMGTPLAKGLPNDISNVTIDATNFIVNGKPYMFRGVNVQFEGLHHPESGLQLVSTQTFDLFRSWNVNLIRVWLNMEMASPSYGSWNQAFFDNLERVLDLSQQYGIYVLLSSLHSYNMGPAFDGTGFPSWMLKDISTKNAAWIALYKSIVNSDPAYSNMRNAIREYINRVATLSKNRNIVLGYDLFNEPQYRDIPGYSKLSASYFYEALSGYYTQVDPYKPQAVENNFIHNDYKPNIPNLFVSPHGYARHTYDYSPSQMKSYFTDSDYWVQGPTWGVPTLNAEWFLGTQEEAQQYGLTASEMTVWYNTYIRAMEELGIGWAVLRCEASPSMLHWSGIGVRNVLLDYWKLNLAPYEPPPAPPLGNVIFSDGFESGSFTNWNGTYATSGEAAVVVGELRHAGSYSAKFASNGGSDYEYAYAYKTVNADEVYVQAYFYISQGLPLVDNDDRFTLVQFFGSSGDVICGVQVKRVLGEDRFFLYGVSGSSSVATQSTTEVYPQRGVWYSIKLYAYIHAIEGAYRVHINGVERLRVTGVNTTRSGDIAAVRIGLATVTSVQHYVTVYCDDAVFVSTVGDVNRDGIVDIVDLAVLAKAYGSSPSSGNWNPAADLNKDGKIDVHDLTITAANFGKT